MLDKMRRYLGVGVAWLGATIVSVAIASAAVAGVRDRVVETPVAMGAPTTTTTVASATTSTFAATTTTSTTTSTTEPPATTSTTSTTVADVEQTTSTTAAPETTTTTSTTTTTTVAPSPSYETYSLVGGTVTLAWGDGVVSVAAVDPNLGYRAETEQEGPAEVKVEFESNDHKSVLRAYFDDGEPKVTKNEEGDDDDHGGDDD